MVVDTDDINHVISQFNNTYINNPTNATSCTAIEE
jgi:hypothetical protein